MLSVVHVAVAFAVGVWAGTFFPQRPQICVLVTACWLAVSAVAMCRSSKNVAAACLLITVSWLGVSRWQVSHAATPDSLRRLASQGHVGVRLQGDVLTVPAIRVREDSALAPRYCG